MGAKSVDVARARGPSRNHGEPHTVEARFSLALRAQFRSYFRAHTVDVCDDSLSVSGGDDANG
jgi:hypothetical protein